MYNTNVVDLPELQLLWEREESIRAVFGPALERAARHYSRGLLSSDEVMEALQVALMIGDPDYS